MIVNLNNDLDEELARHPKVTAARKSTAERISERARAKTRRGRTGKAQDSHRVEVDETEDPPVVAAAAGGADSFHYVFQEFGGVGFRPPLAPLRSAAADAGLRVRR